MTARRTTGSVGASGFLAHVLVGGTTEVEEEVRKAAAEIVPRFRQLGDAGVVEKNGPHGLVTVAG
ncbi:hypothetical protein SAMN05428939_0159 [Streptomyces sp. TLI_105]|nr:hypothetical protein SAMN05428939_0159 [Streptomyces sp. TLI_105]